MCDISEFLIKKIKNDYTDEFANKIINGYSKKRKTTFRVNTIKSNVEKVISALEKEGIKFSQVEWNNTAFVLENDDEKRLQELEIYKNGEIYVQSLSSMLPPILLNPSKGEDILDMAAAPGGKTTQMAAMLNNEAQITAFEINKIRAERLKYNVEKQGVTCAYIMNKDSRQIEDFFAFDKILLDSPCSGSGTIDIEDKNLNKVFNEQYINKLIKTQTELLKKAIKILKTNKEMIYSTCSILKCENEEVIKKVLGNNVEIVPIEFKNLKDLPMLPTSISGTLCIYPTEYYEGFFVAKLRKVK